MTDKGEDGTEKKREKGKKKVIQVTRPVAVDLDSISTILNNHNLSPANQNTADV